MRYRLAIFDFDGTLSDSLAKITGVTNRALSSFGLPERSLEDVRSLVGLPLSEVLGSLGGGREILTQASEWTLHSTMFKT